MATLVVLGSGIMATALATPFTDNGHKVRLVGTFLDRDIIESIKNTGVHPNLNLQVPDGVSAYQLEEAEQAFDGVDLVMCGVNSFGVDWAGEQLAGLLRPGMHVLALAKGMQADDEGNLTILPRALMAHVPQDVRDRVSISAIAGPSIAGEVAIRRHTCVVFTGNDPEVLEMWRGMYATDFYHVWTSTDFTGVEVCAATKNCYAFGAGFMHGQLDKLNETDPQYVNFNYGAALFGQAAVEMTQFMDLVGGRSSTVLGLPGIGDCFVTSMGGRNVKVGRLVGTGLTFTEARATMPGVTLEGAAAIQVIGDAFERLTERGVLRPDQFPLLRHLHDVVANDHAVDVPWTTLFGADGSGQG